MYDSCIASNRSYLIFLLAAILPGCGDPGWREPATFAGVPLMATRDDIGRIFPLANCQTIDRDELSRVSCTARIPFAGAVRDAALVFVGEGSDRFLSMTLRIGRADCEPVEVELVRLYGKSREHSAANGPMHDYWKGRKIGIRLDLPPAGGTGKLCVGLAEPVALLRVRPL